MVHMVDTMLEEKSDVLDTKKVKIRSDLVSAEEIEQIMKGSELVRITKNEIEDLFEIGKLRLKLALSTVPIKNSLTVMKFAFGIALSSLFLVPSLFAESVIGSLMIGFGVGFGSVGVIVFFASLMMIFDANNKKEMAEKIPLFVTSLILGAASFMFFWLAPHVSSRDDIGIAGSTLSTFGSAGLLFCTYLYFSEVVKYSLTCLTLKDERLSGWNIPRDRTEKNLLRYFTVKFPNAPKGVLCNLAYHFSNGYFDNVHYYTIGFDKDAVSKKQARILAADPAITVEKNGIEYFVGAWDIQTDISEIKKQIEVEDKKKPEMSIRERLKDSEFKKLLKEMKKQTNLKQTIN
jgi:hypothetical protein